MHVLVFCPPFGNIGGLESVAAHLVRYLEARGHEVTVVARGARWTDRREPGRPSRGIELPMHQFPRRFRHVARVRRFTQQFLALLPRLRRTVATPRPPDVLLSLAPPNYAPYPLALAWLLGRPLVAGLHADPSHLDRHANRAVHRMLLRRAALLVACSERVAAAAAREVPACRPRLVVIPNGYDPAEFASAAPARAERPFLLAVGRLVPEKGFDLLTEAFALIAAEFPAVDLVIAGDGPEASRLAALTTARGLRDRVRFAGVTDRPTTVSLLLGSAFVCCPSRWESFSLVALEAAAAGKAVVAADAGALPEIVRGDETGLLVSGATPPRGPTR
jgi:glycosyltransferase involved in cell wall biosynthesis